MQMLVKNKEIKIAGVFNKKRIIVTFVFVFREILKKESAEGTTRIFPLSRDEGRQPFRNSPFGRARATPRESAHPGGALSLSSTLRTPSGGGVVATRLR